MALNYKNIKADTLGRVDAALTILERYPKLPDVSSYISANVPIPWSMTDEYNPFMYLLDLFKRTVGYDVFLKILAGFLFTGLEALEGAIKGILLTNIKSLVSCSINPMITSEMLRNGFVFDLRTLDLMGILNYSPMPTPETNFGRYYYFGCDNKDESGTYTCKFPDDIKEQSKDLNAWLWYLKNRSTQREVWKNKNATRTAGDVKDSKKDGIMTLEYVEHSSSLTDAEGGGLTIQQIPHNNCLHVFLGNTSTKDVYGGNPQNIKDAITTARENLSKITRQVSDKESELDECERIIENNVVSKAELKEEKEKRSALKKELKTLGQSKKDAEFVLEQKEKDFGTYLNDEYAFYADSSHQNYKPINLNYYYHRTIMEFNTDYIFNIKLFDPVSVAARLIDAVTRCLSINLNITVEQQIIQHEIKKIITQLNSSDGCEVEINDCFFTFTNTEYNEELNKAELRKLGVYVPEHDTTTGAYADASKLLEQLNGVNTEASQEQNQAIIEECFQNIAAEMSRSEGFDGQTSKLKVGIPNPMDSLLDNLLNNLAYIITSSVLSPKVYLVLAINLKLLGEPTSPDMVKFIDANRNLVAEMIRMIRDEIVKFLVEQLLKVLKELAKELAIRMTVEQMEYYRRLLKRILAALKRFRRKNLDFNIDNIDYADIIDNTEDENLESVVQSWC